MKKGKRSKGLTILLQLICVVVFLYSALQLYQIYEDYHRASEEYSILSEEMIKIVNQDSIYEDEKESQPGTESYDYEVPEYAVDLEAVRQKNGDTIGWIILPDTKINYPILQSHDNTEYLNTTFEGQESSSGAIFVDMLCESDFSSQNTIIYGHNMKNGSMFRALNNLTDKDYFLKHHIFCIDTGDGFEKYEIISCYETTADDTKSWQISFESDEAYALWLKERAERCDYDCVPYNIEKATITLSTCRGKANGTGRFVVYLQKKD